MANRKKMIEEIMATFHAMRNKMHVTLMQSGHRDSITHSQLFVLAIIEKCHDIGIKEISKKLNISSSAATQLVDGLVENGYVVRKADAADRRHRRQRGESHQLQRAQRVRGDRAVEGGRRARGARH